MNEVNQLEVALNDAISKGEVYFYHNGKTLVLKVEE